MTAVRALSGSVLAIVFVCTPAMAQPAAGGAQPGAAANPEAVKPALIATLREIRAQVSQIHRNAADSASVTSLTEKMERSAAWLEDRGIPRWLPKDPNEGAPFLASLQRMVRSLQGVRTNGSDLEILLTALEDDLSIKEQHCREKGLASRQRVFVVTKRKALQEVRGLEVLYIEKFFASDENARPQLFRRFSSPAVDDLVPGRYVFWAKEPGGRGRSGERKEARIGSGLPKEPIEVLAP